MLQLGPENSTSFSDYAPVVYGLFLVFAAVLLRGGVGGLGPQRRCPLWPAGSPRSPGQPSLRTWRPTISSVPGPTASGSGLTAQLNVSGVSKSYGGVQALNDVSLTADPGQVTALIGSNGSGKTTLLNVICGFAAPTAGTVVLGEDNLVGLSPARDRPASGSAAPSRPRPSRAAYRCSTQ